VISFLCNNWQLAIIIAVSFPVLWAQRKNRE
jgi:hypothetical protein